MYVYPMNNFQSSPVCGIIVSMLTERTAQLKTSLFVSSADTQTTQTLMQVKLNTGYDHSLERG